MLQCESVKVVEFENLRVLKCESGNVCMCLKIDMARYGPLSVSPKNGTPCNLGNLVIFADFFLKKILSVLEM